jgi:secreted PhoX family phosphatase
VSAPSFFDRIPPSAEDRLILPKGYDWVAVASWDDPMGSVGPHGPERFGFNNDFLCYFPIDTLSGGKNSKEGLLWANHEYPSPLFVSGYKRGSGLTKTADQVRAEQLCVGGSVVHVRRGRQGQWEHVANSPHNFRLTALYPQIPLSGPVAGIVPEGRGTLGNCSGGRTPWATVLSCEENYPDYNSLHDKYGHRWTDVEAIDENQYGWVVEVNPFRKLPPRKLSALGRFKHENAALQIRSDDKRVVVYMGDDEADQHLYKFVSAGPYDPAATREASRELLTQGTLYAADFLAGKWLPLDLARSPKLKDAGFHTQADVLLDTRKAAKALGATPLDRCEDCEIHPLDGTLYVAMTNNSSHGNYHGQIVRLIEDGGAAGNESFAYEIYLAGGLESGLTCPDNLAFDHLGNLWVVCDISTDRLYMESDDKLKHGAYARFRNNGLHVVPTRGASAGEAFQFASAPVQAELTGPWFTEDRSTLFLSVQHPGEESKSLTELTSNWPSGKPGVQPRPAVVAITGFPW